MRKFSMVFLSLVLMTSLASADLISEFYGNQPGTDPATQDIELLGTPGASFSFDIVSLESDFSGTGTGEGVVDRLFPVSGTYDANGLAVVNVADLENPSFTLILAMDFSGMVGDDLDVGDDGVIDDLSLFTGVMDAVGVIEDSGDPNYADDFGGTYLAPFASTDPDLVFRDASSGDWYYTVGGTVYDEAGMVFTEPFSADPTTPTFGAINPTVIPEPGTIALGLLGILGLVTLSRK